MKYIINDVVVNSVNNEMFLIVGYDQEYYYFYYLCPCKGDMGCNFAFITNVKDCYPIVTFDGNEKIELANF